MYAEDIALITKTAQHMHQLAGSTFAKWALELSGRKTKIMCVGQEEFHAFVSRGELESVEEVKSLGNISSSDISMQPEALHKMSRARQAFGIHIR